MYLYLFIFINFVNICNTIYLYLFIFIYLYKHLECVNLHVLLQVILKPAEATPLTALALAELGRRAGLPPGVLNMVVGEAKKIGKSSSTVNSLQCMPNLSSMRVSEAKACGRTQDVTHKYQQCCECLDCVLRSFRNTAVCACSMPALHDELVLKKAAYPS